MVERDDRSRLATFFSEATLAPGIMVPLSEAAAHHARVIRLEAGDLVRLTDGAGHLAFGDVTSLLRGAGQVNVEHVESVARPAPIHLRVPIGDRDRMLMLAEKATELGVASWQPIRFRRSMSVTPRGEGPAFAEKVRARMISALEQSGGAWLPQMLPDTALEQASVPAAASRILLDASGQPLLRALQLAPADETALVFGPEGGLEPAERDHLLSTGWRMATLADTTLRFETAGVAAVAIVRAHQLASRTK